MNNIISPFNLEKHIKRSSNIRLTSQNTIRNTEFIPNIKIIKFVENLLKRKNINKAFSKKFTKKKYFENLLKRNTEILKTNKTNKTKKYM